MATVLRITDASSDDYDFDDDEVLLVEETSVSHAVDHGGQDGSFGRTWLGNFGWLYTITIRCVYQSTMAGYGQGATAGKIYRMREKYKTAFTVYPYYLALSSFNKSCILLNPDEISDHMIHGRAEADYDIVLRFRATGGSDTGGARSTQPI